MIRPSACLLSTVLGCLSPWASAVDLQTIYQWAVMQDPTFAMADATRLSTQEVHPQALANLLPTLSVATTNQRNKSNSPTTTDYYAYSKALTLSQPLFDTPKWVKLKQAGHTLTATEASFEAAEQDLIIRVATQYFAVLKAQDTLSFSTGQRAAFEKQLDQVKQRFEVGVAAMTDLQDAQSRRDSAVAQEIVAKTALEDEYERLRQITGSPAEELATLSTEAPLLSPDPLDEDAWVDMAEQRNPALHAAKETKIVAREEIWHQRMNHLPTLSAFAELSKANTAPPGVINVTQKIVGLTGSWNLFNGGTVLSQTRQARADYLKADQQWEYAFRQTVSLTRQAYRGMLTSAESTKAFQQALISAKSDLEATQAAYEVGTRTIVDVLSAETNLLQARQNVASARYDIILNYLRLKQQAGLLSPSDVVEINQWLN